MFIISSKNIFPTFVLTLRQYGGLNHVILRLRDFFLFVFVLVELPDFLVKTDVLTVSVFRVI